MTVATDKIKISAYLDSTLKTDADKLAKADKRSLSNLVEVLIQEAVDRAKAEGKI